MKIKVKIKELGKWRTLDPSAIEIGLHIRVMRRRMYNSHLRGEEPPKNVWIEGKVEALERGYCFNVNGYGFTLADRSDPDVDEKEKTLIEIERD